METLIQVSLLSIMQPFGFYEYEFKSDTPAFHEAAMKSRLAIGEPTWTTRFEEPPIRWIPRMGCGSIMNYSRSAPANWYFDKDADNHLQSV